MAELKITEVDRTKVFKDLLYFGLVPLTFYLTAVLGVIQLPNHVISLKDFVPSNNTIIAIIAWLMNQLLNTIKKIKRE